MTETLLQGDCLKLLPTIQDNSIDMILADLPYGGVTAKHLKRNFIGMELDKEYFKIAKQRIDEA